MTTRGSRQRTAVWFAVPAAIALVASGVFVGRMSARPAKTDAAERERPVKATDDRRARRMELELRRLRAEVAALSQAASRPAAVQEAEQDADEREPSPAATMDPEETERAVEAQRAEFFDGLADRLESEPGDAAFGAETEPLISRLLSHHLGPDVQVSDVACGSSLCRAKVTHPEGPRLSEDRLTDFMLQREALGEMSVQLDLREEGVTTLYFVRGDG